MQKLTTKEFNSLVNKFLKDKSIINIEPNKEERKW